jgi:hypothetical protein
MPTAMESAWNSGGAPGGSLPCRTNPSTSARSCFQSKRNARISVRPPVAFSTSATMRWRIFLAQPVAAQHQHPAERQRQHQRHQAARPIQSRCACGGSSEDLLVVIDAGARRASFSHCSTCWLAAWPVSVCSMPSR